MRSSLSRKKRGRQPSKLFVKLFLLDPAKVITKVTKETRSKENIIKLMQEGYGPPQPEHCVNDDNKGRVEFLFELTNEQFKQKLVEIYPKLENACFVFMKPDKNNKLEELNPGRCCYRCYTPENVYHSERGHGRLYIQKIAENQISQCTHGIPLTKRLRVGNNQIPTSTIVSATPPASSVFNMIQQGRLQTSSGVFGPYSRLRTKSSGNTSAQSLFPASTVVSVNESNLPPNSSGNIIAQSELQTSTIIPYTSANVLEAVSIQPVFNQSTTAMTTEWQNLSPNVVENLLETGPSYRNQSLSAPLSAFPSRRGRAHSSGIQTPANANVERGPIIELLTASTSSLTTPVGQEHVNSAEPKISIEEFLEKVKSTEKLEISLDVLNNSELMKKLNESTTNIRTIEIQSSCKLQQILKDYSLPSCLEVLRIHGNYLNHKDIHALAASCSNMNCLYELDLSRTKFEEGCIISFIGVLVNCSNLRKLYLTDNSLVKEDISCITNVFKSMKGLTHLHVSKNNLTETQANNILQNVGQHKSMVCLDLSRNALQGNEFISEICQITSLEELSLSHNRIRFFSLPNSGQKHDNLPVNMQVISLSSNDMTPTDIVSFCNLITSNLVKLNLDLNHVGPSIWFLCSLNIEHLKVLSLAKCDVNGFKTIDGLAILLRYTRELEELNLSCNNLMLNDFRKLQTHLSNLTQLKKLNLSNNPDGISSILQEILPSLKHLEELRLSNVHLNGEDFRKISVALASLESLKLLDLSGNAIGPVGAKALARILKEFPLLERLDLSSSCMKEDDIIILCTGLTLLKNLKYLNLSGNRIAVEVFNDSLLLPSSLEEVIFSDVIHGEKLFDAMRPLRYLRKLHFNEMKLRPRDVEALSTMLSSCSLLEDLTLSNIDIVDFRCERIFSAIKSLTNIRKIDLSGMILPDGGALADMLFSCSLLEELVLNGMAVADRDCERIFIAIKFLKKMKKLDFGGMKVKTLNMKAFSHMLSSLSFLEEIVFPGVFYGDDDDYDDGMKRLLNSLKLTRYLKILDLGDRCISNSCAATLAQVIPCLQLLEKLVIKTPDFQSCGQQLLTALETLRYLKVLDLDFTICKCDAGVLTKVLPSLHSLEKLVLGIIEFDDEGASEFFCAVGSLKYLKELDLRKTLCTGTGTEALADALPRLKFLEKLTLIEIKFLNKQSLQRLLAALGSLRYLREIDVKFHKEIECITKASPYKLPSLQLLEKLVLKNIECYTPEEQLLFEMPSYAFLRHLTLLYVKINSAALANVLSQQCLEELSMWANEYNDNESESLFDAIGKLHNLKKLELPNITFTETSVKTLRNALSSLQHLEKLDFAGTYLHREIGKQLFDVIRKVKYLKELHLGYMIIDQTGAEALAEALPSLKSLEGLELGQIEFDDGKEEQLLNSVRELMYLKELRFHSTLATQNSVTALAEVLPSLHFLKKLRLEYIDFRNKNDQQLFTIIGTLKCLKRLRLSGNVITQACAGSLTDVLGNLPGLTYIRLPEIEGDSDGKLSKKLKEECSDLGIDLLLPRNPR